MKLPFPFRGHSATDYTCQEAIKKQYNLIESACQIGVKKTLQQFHRSMRKADAEKAAVYIERIRTLCTLKEEMAELLDTYLDMRRPFERAAQHQASPEEHPVAIPVYCVSSMTLHQCYQHLMQSKPNTNEEPEWMLAVTGLRIGPFLTLEHWLTVTLSHQSRAQAAADTGAFTQLMLKLDTFGQALHAIFHSHRFNGPPRPSGIDLNLQKTLEQASYPAIQAVFSQDGYVRFFAWARPFEMLVYGQGVEKYERFLYRLDQIGKIRNP
ncbi:MAG: hypothetical protein ACUVR2_08115 [Anaerolineae bacterium]